MTMTEFESQMIAQYTKDGRYILLLTKSIPAHYLISLHAIQGFVNDIHLLHRRFTYQFTLSHFNQNNIPVFFETIKRLVREQKAKGIFTLESITQQELEFDIDSILERESLTFQWNHYLRNFSRIQLSFKENGLSLQKIGVLFCF